MRKDFKGSQQNNYKAAGALKKSKSDELRFNHSDQFVYDNIQFNQINLHNTTLSSSFKETPTYGTADGDDEQSKNLAVSDIIGNFGWFQLVVLIFSGLREACVGYDAVVMSIVLRPEPIFRCADSDNHLANVSDHNAQVSPFVQPKSLNISLADQQCAADCNSYVFPSHRYGVSLVADWQLVCHRHWLIAFTESSYFLGLVLGNLIWGYYADKIGRRRTYLYAHTVGLVAGWITLVTPNIYLFSLCRFLSAFGLIGYNIIYSIQVELIGCKYRAFSTVMNHLGWGLGVICVPMIAHTFTDYRYIAALAPLITLLMYPWAFWIPESSRWLMIHGKYSRANADLIRIAKFNGKLVTPVLEKKLHLLNQRVRYDKLNQEATGTKAKQSYRMIISNPVLLNDTLVLAYISFTGHLFYYILTINFAYIDNLSTEANFIISGAGEWVSVIVGAILLKFFCRKTCLSLFLAFVGGVFIFQAVLDSNIMPSLDTPFSVTTNNAIGTLSSLLLIFVTLIVNQEIYPTVIRQTGSSVVNTLGESGSTLAPILLYLAKSIGLWKADLIYAVICLIGVIGAQFITKTDDIELTDT